jgi:hypothetical protein
MADTISSIEDTAKDIAKDTTKEENREMAESDTGARFERFTAPDMEERLRRELEARVHYFAQRPEEIDRRLEELDEEWDIERLVEANVGAFSLMGLTFGVVRRRWYLLSAVAAALLIQHAFQGWSAPASVLRRLGIRTREEIDHERYALKALRGDFVNVQMEGNEDPQERARRAIEAANRNV